ncbi:endophilin-A-like isoform X1 [Penaeus chinensis]|uniref:endophilin-A-like isoform X1 n=1 Tax=Penaeus chinensis TaxID=139456 RepID=UPI001FB68FDF|nr:endophilin-A-like isoform X1 [Penaeus chinensis]XP_047489414.1 endophilin-A-like isoform X1 [Penaeus chinensis]XP_047489415.1 endophilin-A-like isoform X1 [Penaeus chinensis]XP_047489416.1 endophilin-A-like isoform X1 [Penaeus chinensis]
MAFAGLKKQINKANQFMNEKIGGVEGTKLDDDFVEMERKTDIMCELVEDLQLKIKEFLHPNPASRAKMSAVKGIGKLSGQAKAATYPQPEGVLGETLITFGKKIGEENLYAQSLVETGESMKQIADIKYNLDDNMKMNVIEPLHQLSTKDIKEVQHHRKKLQGRRLDFDCKKRKKDKALYTPSSSPARSPGRGAGSHVSEDEIKLAEDKFAESLHLAQMGMHNLLDNDVEQISQLTTFAENLLDYHRQCTEILEALAGTLHDKKNEAASLPRSEFVPKTLSDLGVIDSLNGGLPTTNITATTPQRSPYGSPARSPAHTPTHTPQYPGSSPLPSPMSSGQPNWDPLFPPGGPPRSTNASPLPSPMKSPARSPMMQAPSAQALYDFEPENPGELGFNEGDTITLTQRIDENWFEGSINGKSGLFPVSYVNVVVPLP